jgi:hypothetical protein
MAVVGSFSSQDELKKTHKDSSLRDISVFRYTGLDRCGTVSTGRSLFETTDTRGKSHNQFPEINATIAAFATAGSSFEDHRRTFCLGRCRRIAHGFGSICQQVWLELGDYS